MNEKIEKNPVYLSPFKRMCMTIGELPSSYVETMSYYEMLLWFCKYLSDTVIPAINNNAEALKEVQELFVELQTYVNDYFENLDVQDEINNKLDQMVEDGTFDVIVERYILHNIQNNLNIRKMYEYHASSTDLHEGVEHDYLQGFCEIGNDVIVMGLVNADASNNDNMVKLVEYNLSNGSVLRYKYLELNHCNSITYDETNELLYVASISKKVNGVLVNDPTIFVVDYDTFNIVDTILVSNLPSSKHIRSVSYDNENHVLYAGDRFTMFKINIDDQEISETIELDTHGLEVNIINQTLAKWKNFYVGIYMTFIGIWNLDGSIYRIFNLQRLESGMPTGEPEDFFIRENGDMIIGSVTTYNAYKGYRNANFSYTNLYTNTSNELRPDLAGDISQPITITVNNDSGEAYEDGTEKYPYKDLQKALIVAQNFTRASLIQVYGSSYGACTINGISNLSLSFNSNITVDGLLINNSTVAITHSASLTINGIQALRSKVILSSPSGTHASISYFRNKSASLNGKAVDTLFSSVFLRNCDITSSGADTITSTYSSDLTLEGCTLDGYTGHSAINSIFQSTVKLDSCTFSVASSTTQHLISAYNKSIIYPQNDLTSLNDFDLHSYSKVIGSGVNVGLATPVYIGEICANNLNFQFAKLKLKGPGLVAGYKFLDIPTTAGTYLVDASWSNNVALKTSQLLIVVTTSTITISDNRKVVAGSTYSWEQVSTTPAETTQYLGVSDVIFHN